MNVSSFRLSAIVALALTWLSLASMSQNVIIWNEWIQNGPLFYWNQIKEILSPWLIKIIVYDHLPSYFFELLTLFCILSRVVLIIDEREGYDYFFFILFIAMSWVTGSFILIGITLFSAYAVQTSEVIYARSIGMVLSNFLINTPQSLGLGATFLFCKTYLEMYVKTFFLKERLPDKIEIKRVDDAQISDMFYNNRAEIVLWVFSTGIIFILSVFVFSDLLDKIGA